MRQTAVAFKSKGLTLEGVLTLPDELPHPYPAIVMCHPHPMLGGNMDDSVVSGVCRSAAERGIAAFRFNFQGVESSEGEFANGDAQRDDVKAALNMVRRWPGIDGKRVALGGYSYSAGLILRDLRRFKIARSLALIAPPLSSIRGSRIIKDKRPKLFIVGQNDRLAPSVELQRALDGVRKPLQFREIAGADHGLIGYEREVGEQVAGFVAESLA